VLVRDKNTVESQVLMDVLDKVRGRYSGRVEFLLTDYDTQQGRKFVADHHAASTTLVLFDADGKQLKILTAPQTAASLEQAITNIIGAKI
jgi:hypothetical protein